MSIVDAIILTVLVISVLVSFVRGFFREFMSLATWVVAVLVTLFLSRQFATLLPRDTIESVTARLSISAITLFIGCLLIGALINFLFQKLNESKDIGWVNRLLGIVFGLGRGVIIVSMVVLGAHLFPGMQQEVWWQQSRLLPNFDKVAQSIHKGLPQELADHFDFATAASRSASR